MKRWALMVIRWVDADHGSGWQMSHEESHLPGAQLCVSVGYFLRETDDSIKLVQSYTSKGLRDEQVNGLLTIPKSAIKYKRVVRG